MPQNLTLFEIYIMLCDFVTPVLRIRMRVKVFSKEM